MGVKLDIREQNNRVMYRRAKSEFNETYFIKPRPMNEAYWDAFGKAHNLKVIILEWQGLYPVIEALEFNTEAAYVWFMLRWS